MVKGVNGQTAAMTGLGAAEEPVREDEGSERTLLLRAMEHFPAKWKPVRRRKCDK